MPTRTWKLKAPRAINSGKTVWLPVGVATEQADGNLLVRLFISPDQMIVGYEKDESND